MTWPKTVDWQALRFGLEIEFIGGDPAALPLLPGWKMALDEYQVDEQGCESGSELQSPPLRWAEREQIATMLERLRAQGAVANWSCGLHVHVGLEPWGEAMVLPLLDAALRSQEALRDLVQMTPHRAQYCPPVAPAMRERYLAAPFRDVLVYRGRPQSHRCGINTAAWYDIQTVEIRYGNGSLDPEEVFRYSELCLRFVAAVGAGQGLPDAVQPLAAALGVPVDGYPPPVPAPRWYAEQMALADLLIPVLTPLVERMVPAGEIRQLRPGRDGLRLEVERPDNSTTWLIAHPNAWGWRLAAES